VNVEYQQANANRLNKIDAYRRKKIIERSQEQQAMQDKLQRMKLEFQERKSRPRYQMVHKETIVYNGVVLCLSSLP
jgi:hypothetical protein